MRLSKTISALFLSFVILFASLTQANAKRLHAAIADWTGGIITCEVAVGILEREILSNKEKSKVNQGDEIELEMRLLIKSFDYENTITGKIKKYWDFFTFYFIPK